MNCWICLTDRVSEGESVQFTHYYYPVTTFELRRPSAIRTGRQLYMNPSAASILNFLSEMFVYGHYGPMFSSRPLHKPLSGDSSAPQIECQCKMTLIRHNAVRNSPSSHQRPALILIIQQALPQWLSGGIFSQPLCPLHTLSPAQNH